jgi:hypothetical protein
MSVEFFTFGQAFNRYAALPSNVRGRIYMNAPVYVLGEDGECVLNPVHDMGAEMEEWFAPELRVDFEEARQ